jgi:hypothetical protein
MFLFLLGIIWLVAIALTIRNIFERNDLETNTKLLWTILILVVPYAGVAIYYLFGDRRAH